MKVKIKQIFCKHYWRNDYWKKQLRYLGVNWGYEYRSVCKNCGKLSQSEYFFTACRNEWKDKTGKYEIDHAEMYRDEKELPEQMILVNGKWHKLSVYEA